MKAAMRARLSLLLYGERAQAMIEYSTIVFFLLGVVILAGGSSVMKDLIESISAYFRSHYFALQFPM